MKHPLYIISSSAISPQHTFDVAAFTGPMTSSDNNQLHVIDADYRQFISPVAIRRMSRLLKMGISAGMKSIQDAGIEKPDAIITGTAHGSISDMAHFLRDMIELNEGALNPTFFIQSTYNSVNGWLAMQTKCTGYNQTFVHRGYSFELALFDAHLMVADAEQTKYVLVGGYDETHEDFFISKEKLDYWKKEPINSLSLLEHTDTDGTISGEGAAFFVVTNNKEKAICSMEEVHLMQDVTFDEILKATDELLQKHNLTTNDIDLFLSGANGDARTQGLFDQLANKFPETTTVAAYKHLCGEYDTATAFGMWIATQCYKTGSIPEATIIRKGTQEKITYTLICNRYVLNNASLILLKSVE